MDVGCRVGFAWQANAFSSCPSTPLRPGKQEGRIPEGRRARCATFSDGTGMCLTKMPSLVANRFRVAEPTGRQGGLLCLLDQPAAVEERLLAIQESKTRKARNAFAFGKPELLKRPAHAGIRIPQAGAGASTLNQLRSTDRAMASRRAGSVISTSRCLMRSRPSRSKRRSTRLTVSGAWRR